MGWPWPGPFFSRRSAVTMTSSIVPVGCARSAVEPHANADAVSRKTQPDDGRVRRVRNADARRRDLPLGIHVQAFVD
jgi:hypothetical protein